MYKTELHCHSAQVSACATATPEELVKLYVECGYSTVVLTNHLSKKTYKNKRFDHSDDPWDVKMDYYMSGYHELCEAAKGKLHIILGCELSIFNAKNHLQLYGVTEEFLRAHPELLSETAEKLSPVIRKAGIFFVQAHPFRDKTRVIDPKYLDGIEVYNGSRGHDSRNDIAYKWAEKFGLAMTSGTDFHSASKTPTGGILTEKPITNKDELLETLRSGKYELFRSNEVPY